MWTQTQRRAVIGFFVRVSFQHQGQRPPSPSFIENPGFLRNSLHVLLSKTTLSFPTVLYISSLSHLDFIYIELYWSALLYNRMSRSSCDGLHTRASWDVENMAVHLIKRTTVYFTHSLKENLEENSMIKFHPQCTLYVLHCILFYTYTYCIFSYCSALTVYCSFPTKYW